jgi:ABC-2 type transport system ATP-binding protein
VLLEVDGLSKRFGSTRALDAVSCHVERGEILGLIGPNGAGKTTLFECVAGLTPADGGEVRSGGAPLAPDRRRDVVFFMPDGIEPWPAQTTACALAFFAGLYGVPRARVSEVVDALGLAPVATTKIGALSKGYRKRALLALGLLTPQPLLLCDEPFDGLDLRQTREVTAVLRRQTAAGRTLFLSIHQLNDAARVCDRLVLLSGGRSVGEGTLAELVAHAGLSARHEIGLEEVFLALT